MIKKAFVTGGSGFVGKNLIRVLRENGTEVVALARSDKAIQIVKEAGATPVTGDLSTIDALINGMAGCDVVFHLAALTKMWGDFNLYREVNVAGTQNVVKAARTAGVPTLVHISTEAVLTGGQPIVNADETRPRSRSPLGPYARTKAQAEEVVLAANSQELKTVIVRPRLIWGPGDTETFPTLVALVRSGGFAFINGGHYLTSTCHVANVAEGLILAAEKGRGGEIYYLSDGEPIEFRTFVTEWLGTADVQPPDKNMPGGVAKIVAGIAEFMWVTFKLKGKPPITRAEVQLIGEEVTVNDAKARRELGYQGRVSRAVGLQELKAEQQRATSSAH